MFALQAIFAWIFEVRGTLRLKHSGMEFAVWTFKHASQEPLERASKPALQGLLMLLDNGVLSTQFTTRTHVTLRLQQMLQGLHDNRAQPLCLQCNSVW